MSETHINKEINRAEVKVGDKIRISREFTVTALREAKLGRASGDAIIVSTSDVDTLALTNRETVTLIERDEGLDFGNGANVVTWRVKAGAGEQRCFAVRGASGPWIADDQDTYATDKELSDDILASEFGDYVEGSFEVVLPKPHFSSGGVVGVGRHGGVVGGGLHNGFNQRLSAASLATIAEAARREMRSPILSR